MVLATHATSLVEPPSLWDAVRAVVNSVFGAGSVIAWFISTLILAWIWFRWAHGTYQDARRAGDTVISAGRAAIRHLDQTPSSKILVTVSATLVGLVFQTGWLVSTFGVSCAMSAIVGQGCQWDRFTGTYTLACVTLLFVAYTLAVTEHEDGVLPLGVIPNILPALAAVIWAVLAAILTLLQLVVLLLPGDNGEDWGLIGVMWLVPLFFILYMGMTFAALGTSMMVVSRWKRAHQPPE